MKQKETWVKQYRVGYEQRLLEKKKHENASVQTFWSFLFANKSATSRRWMDGRMLIENSVVGVVVGSRANRIVEYDESEEN